MVGGVELEDFNKAAADGVFVLDARFRRRTIWWENGFLNFNIVSNSPLRNI